MEIGPIPAMRAIAAVKPRPIDPELSALFDIEPSARAGDDTYTGTGKKAAGAEENDEEDAEELEEISADEPSAQSRNERSQSQISFFA